jgi:hypothetical protein
VGPDRGASSVEDCTLAVRDPTVGRFGVDLDWKPVRGLPLLFGGIVVATK